MDFLMTNSKSTATYSLSLTGRDTWGVQWETFLMWQVCLQGRWRYHHHSGAGSGHEDIRLDPHGGRAAGPHRGGGPGWQWLYHLQWICLVDDKVNSVNLTTNYNQSFREIHDGDIEDEIREAFRWIYFDWNYEWQKLFDILKTNLVGGKFDCPHVHSLIIPTVQAIAKSQLYVN